jgi:hypothetical protein
VYAHSHHSAKRIRRVTFFTVSALVISGAMVVDIIEPPFLDATMFLYLSTMILSGACLWLFIDWWWCMHKTATRIYACITLLLLSIGYKSAFNLYARSIYMSNDMVDLRLLYESNLWQYRALPELIVLIYLFAYALARSSAGKDDE